MEHIPIHLLGDWSQMNELRISPERGNMVHLQGLSSGKKSQHALTLWKPGVKGRALFRRDVDHLDVLERGQG
jgi:hypothetical protein